MLSKKKIISISALLPLFIALFSAPGAHASTFPTCPTASSGGTCAVSIDPSAVVVSDPSGNSFTISVLFSNVDHLAIYEVYFNYNPNVLTATNIALAPGAPSTTFWCQSDCGSVRTFASEIVQGTGTVHVGQGITFGGNVAIGTTPLILFQVTFSANHPGTSSLFFPTSDPNGADNPKISECTGIGMCTAESIATVTGGSAFIPPYFVTLSPGSLTIPQGSFKGSANNAVVTVTSNLGFIGSVTLTSSSPNTAFSKPSVSLTKTAASASVVVSAEAQPCTAAGTYPVTVTAVAGSQSISSMLSVTVTSAAVSNSFCVSASPNDVGTLSVGVPVTTSINFCSFNLSGSLTLTVNIPGGGGLPHRSISTSSVTLTSANDCSTGTPVSVSMTLTATKNTNPGPFAISVTGAVVNVPEFYTVITGSV